MPKPLSLDLDALHPAQQQVSDERKRFNVLSCGRRWGKTDFTYHLIAEICRYNLNNDLHEDMGYMSPTYKNLEPTWRKFTRMFEKLITKKSETYHTAEILNSFLVEFWSLDKPENIRGRQYKRVIVDEAALVLALKEIFEMIILPTLGDLVGDAFLFSTPRGFNDFHQFYRMGQNPLLIDWASWIKPTSSNPYFPAQELETQRALLTPSQFAQEWEGQFVALGNSPFDIDYFKKFKTLDLALDNDGKKETPLYKIRYWDIANSEDGDYTASSRLTITETPRFIISNPVRYKGLWGNNYPHIKQQILLEPDVLHIIETAGVGGIAYQMLKMDADLNHIQIMPASRVFTMTDKNERAQLWALELINGRMVIVEDFGHIELLDEIASFPFGKNDDQVDAISGNMLGFIYFYGGYAKLLKSKVISPQTAGKERPSYEKEDLISQLVDVM